MSLDFYYFPPSAPCRAVMLTAETIGVTLNGKIINIFEGDQLTPEYEQMNPRKKIPLLVDGDYKLSESRAIMGYLVDEYGKDQRLYPAKPSARALVDQRLYFDIGTLYKLTRDYYFPKLEGIESDSALYEKLIAAFEVLEKYLENQDYVAGRNMTIADLAIIATVTTAETFGFDLSTFENVAKWVERMKESVPGYESINGAGLEIFKKIIEDSMGTEEKEDEED